MRLGSAVAHPDAVVRVAGQPPRAVHARRAGGEEHDRLRPVLRHGDRGVEVDHLATPPDGEHEREMNNGTTRRCRSLVSRTSGTRPDDHHVGLERLR